MDDCRPAPGELRSQAIRVFTPHSGVAVSAICGPSVYPGREWPEAETGMPLEFVELPFEQLKIEAETHLGHRARFRRARPASL